MFLLLSVFTLPKWWFYLHKRDVCSWKPAEGSRAALQSDLIAGAPADLCRDGLPRVQTPGLTHSSGMLEESCRCPCGPQATDGVVPRTGFRAPRSLPSSPPWPVSVLLCVP